MLAHPSCRSMRRPAGAARRRRVQVNLYTTSSLLATDVTMDGDGGFVVVWQSFGQDGEYQGVFTRRFSGSQGGGEFQVNLVTQLHQFQPLVVDVGADGFMVVWENNSASPGLEPGSSIQQACRWWRSSRSTRRLLPRGCTIQRWLSTTTAASACSGARGRSCSRDPTSAGVYSMAPRHPVATASWSPPRVARSTRWSTWRWTLTETSSWSGHGATSMEWEKESSRGDSVLPVCRPAPSFRCTSPAAATTRRGSRPSPEVGSWSFGSPGQAPSPPTAWLVGDAVMGLYEVPVLSGAALAILVLTLGTAGWWLLRG
jgi:hypothetical protein